MNFLIRFCVFTLFACMCLGFAGESRAAGPDLMNYNGFLRDNGGDPVNGTPELIFRIYSASTGGALLWSENHGPVTVQDGVFSVVLGEIRAMDETLFSADRWIETSVDGTAMAPRRQFLSVPYAMRATVADVALNAEGDTDWTIDGSNVHRDDGNVGIGETEPVRKLHIETSDLGIDSGEISANVDIIVESRDASLGLYSDGTGENGSSVALFEYDGGVPRDSWSMRRDTFGSDSELHFIYNDGASGDTKLMIEKNGDTGIGTISPGAKLEVVGDVEAEEFRAGQDLGPTATPDFGATHRDNVICAWAHVRGDGVILSSYGVDSILRLAAGRYEVRLQNTFSNGVCATVTAQAVNDPILATTNVSPNSIDVVTRIFIPGNHNFMTTDNAFYIQVTARP